jgi:N-acetyltransferase
MDVRPVTLDGVAVRLEPLRSEHSAALAEVGLDPSLWRWTTSVVRSAADMERYVETALAERAAGQSLPFATIERVSGRIVGSTRFGSIATAHRRAEIGWTWIGREWQRTAINTEAKLLMLAHAFEHWRCIRVELKTDVLNERSRRAIERLGAREEGTLRHHMVTEEGRVRDTVYYSILADEWPAVRRELETKLSARRVPPVV